MLRNDRTSAKHSCSFDHLVGLRLKRQRDREAKGSRGLEVDHELELSRLQHWKVRRRCALQNTPGVNPGLPIRCGDARSVADQAASSRKCSVLIDRRNAMLRR